MNGPITNEEVESGRLSWLACWLAGLFAAIAFVGNLGTFDFETSKATTASVVVLVGAVLFAWDRSKRGAALVVPWPMWVVGGLSAYVLAVSLIGTPTYWGNFQLAKRAALFVLGVVAAVKLGEGDLRWLGRLLSAVFAGLGVFTAVGAAGGLGGDFLRFALPLELNFGNQNILGGFLVMSVGPLLGAAAAERDRRWRVVAAVAIVSVGAMVVMTQSRNMVATLFIAGGLFLAGATVWAWRWPRRRVVRWLGGYVGAAAVVIVIVLAVQPALRGKLRQAVVGKSTQTRLMMYRSAVDLLADSPTTLAFGHGSGRFRGRFSTVDSRTYGMVTRFNNTLYVHNEYIEIWFEAGLIGLGAFGVIVVVTLRRGWRAMRDPSRSTAGRLWLVGLMVGMACYLVFGLASVANRYIGAQAWFIVCLGGTLAMSRPPKSGGGGSGDSSAGAGTGPKTKLALAGLIVLGATAAATSGWYLANGRVKLDEAIALRAGRAEPARAYERLESLSVLGIHDPDALFWQVKLVRDLDRPMAMAERAFERLQRQVPYFKSSAHEYGRLLLEAGRYAEASALLSRHGRAHPLFFEGQLDRCVAAAMAGDRAALEEGLADLLGAVVDFLSIEHGHAVSMSIERRGESEVIVIRTGEGGAKAEMRRSSLPSALLGGAPGSIAEGRAVIAAKLNGLFVRLGLPRMDFGTGFGRMRGGGPGGDR